MPVTEPIVRRMLQFYARGDIGLVEMQTELIAALVDLAEKQGELILEGVMRSPLPPIIVKRPDEGPTAV